MPSVSGLGPGQRLRARERAVQAAVLTLNHAPLDYSQDAKLRWDGIANRRNSRHGKFPKHADCSSFITWCLWNALFLQFGLGDLVNGQGWTGGYTGTMLDHGMQVQHLANLLRGDLIHYGEGTSAHVTMYVGRKDGVPQVIGWGGEGGPFASVYNYRNDVKQFRRYI